MATFHLLPPPPSSGYTPTISRRHTLRLSRRCAFPPRAKALPPETSSTRQNSWSENVVLKLAWYGSEMLGIATSLFRRPVLLEEEERGALEGDGESALVARERVVQAIRDDFQRSYFVTGKLTLNAYEENCEFAEPDGSFKGLHRFKRNCKNFGSFLVKSDMKLTKWEDFKDKGVGHWRFSCVMAFPWRPILSATGYTEYYFDSRTGKVCRHVENWNVSKMVLLKKILKPSRWVWDNKADT